MAWFPWSRSRRDDGGPARADDRLGEPSPLVSRQELEEAVASLREVLTHERARVRPDTWSDLWTLVEGAAELAPIWERVAGARGTEALELTELLRGALPRALDAFLALPDSMKPAHAGQFQEQVSALGAEIRRCTARLTRVVTASFRAQGELLSREE